MFCALVRNDWPAGEKKTNVVAGRTPPSSLGGSVSPTITRKRKSPDSGPKWPEITKNVNVIALYSPVHTGHFYYEIHSGPQKIEN